MDRARFPKQKYLRQLHTLYRELGDWRLMYVLAMSAHPDDWFGAKCSDREAVLADAQHQLHGVIEALDGLPRLS